MTSHMCDLFVTNIMELVENTTTFFNQCIFNVLCLPLHEQVIHEIKCQTMEQRTLYPSKCVVSACGLSREHELQIYLRNICETLNTIKYYLSSLKMIPANHRPDHCHDFSQNCDSVMISDEITDSLVSLLKINYKNKICFSVQSLYRFTET